MSQKFPMRLERRFPAKVEEVFRSWTDPEEIVEWYRPVAEWRTQAEVDVKVGGTYKISFGPTGTEYVETGEYLAIDAPKSLSYTVRLEGPSHQVDTVVVVSFEVDGDGTRVVINEDYPTAEDRDKHEQGWGLFLNHLEAKLGKISIA